MNQLIEQAFLAATTATNDGVQVIPALAGLQYRTGTDYKINKPEDDTYIVECNDGENVVGPLWKATIRFRLESPAFGETDDAKAAALAAFSARAAALLAWIATPANMNTAAITGMALAGYKIVKSGTNTEGAQWVSEVEIFAGVDTSP